MTPADFPLDDYQALTAGAGFVVLDGAMRIEFAGPDAQAFANNFCTNNVRDLKPGEGCEAFVTDVRGHVIGHGRFSATTGVLFYDTLAAQSPSLSAHWDRYLIREKVELADRTPETRFWSLGGMQAGEKLAQFGSVPSERLRHTGMLIGGVPVHVARVDWSDGPVWQLAAQASGADAIEAALVAVGIRRCASSAWDALRIEAGYPLYGTDISNENLPQEVRRDAQAISFTKGCYLGQETVARIDALGHVNKLLGAVRGETQAALQPGLDLMLDGKSRGRLLSSAYSPRLDAPLALAYLRREANAPGTRFETTAGPVEVVATPLS